VPSLSGKRVLVTGGTTGIGRAIARLLASYGARIFTFGRHQPELDDALQSIREFGAQIDGLVGDVADRVEVERIFREAELSLGGIDILINNAGLPGDAILKENDDDWRYSVETNLLGYMACAKQAASRMRTAGGHIVFIGSMAADERGADSSVYVAAKAGIDGFVTSFRKEVGKEGIKVTLIEPGAVGSDFDGSSPAEQRERIRKDELLRAEDIAVSVHYALTQPRRCEVLRVQLRSRLEEG
jgi:NADP-dependent 3-hydroxy acid dehydrogenase YdfG